MNKWFKISILIIGTLIVCGCTTTSTTVPTTTVPTTTFPTTGVSTTYSSYLYNFTVEIPEGWEQESMVDGISFYTDNARWMVAIQSFELDEPISVAELEEGAEQIFAAYESGFSPENGYSEYERITQNTTLFISPDLISYPELYIQYTFTLNGVEMWGDLSIIFTYDRFYNIIFMCNYDRLYADDYHDQAMHFYRTFEPSFTA